jgi:hypothetical protein
MIPEILSPTDSNIVAFALNTYAAGRGINQKQLGISLNFNKVHICYVLNGTRPVSLHFLRAALLALPGFASLVLDYPTLSRHIRDIAIQGTRR